MGAGIPTGRTEARVLTVGSSVRFGGDSGWENELRSLGKGEVDQFGQFGVGAGSYCY